MSDNLTQVSTLYVNAPAAQVWDAITTPEGTQEWGYGGPVQVDLRPGGDYVNGTTPSMRAMGMADVAVTGTVEEVTPHERLVLSWQPAWHPGSTPSRLTWELTQFDGPVTKVVLTHDLSAAPEYADEVRGGGDPAQGAGGWPWSLASLKTYLETGQRMVGAGSS